MARRRAQDKLSRPEVEMVLKQGSRRFLEGLSFAFLYRKQKECRLAVIISQGVEKSAVKRNALRRRFREAFRSQIKPDDRGCYLVLLVQKAGYPAERCVQDLKKVLSFIRSRSPHRAP